MYKVKMQKNLQRKCEPIQQPPCRTLLVFNLHGDRIYPLFWQVCSVCRMKSCDTAKPALLSDSDLRCNIGELKVIRRIWFWLRQVRISVFGFLWCLAFGFWSFYFHLSTACRIARVCSGVLPQHEPIMFAPASSASGTAAA